MNHADATETLRARDRAAIERVIENWNLAWTTKDAKLAAGEYSEDADWTNAFGMSGVGRGEIERILTEVFALPFVMAGDSETVDQSIRFLEPHIALVLTRVQRLGQLSPSGEDIGIRRTSHLRILSKDGSGWQIISYLISDARSTQGKGH
jgi:uncharacterized protein (TIGR02246 family)